MHEQPGRNRYQILFDLAQGGMGVVSVAQLHGDRGFRRMVAVKRIHGRLVTDAHFYDLFAREARLASKIRDPGVVQVHELVEQSGELVLVMELVEGVSLRRLGDAMEEAGHAMPLGAAARIIATAAEALHGAHTARDDSGQPLGLIHRDISPQNILISFRGDVKVTDFGIAKAMSAEEHSDSMTALRGKPAYFSPEQARAERLDARSDVWSLGVVAHELLTGQRLFKGRSDLETLQRVLNFEVPRVDAIRPDVPPALADAVERALQRSAAGRFASAADLARAVTEAASALPVGRAQIAELIARHLPDEERAFGERLKLSVAQAEDTSRMTAARPGLSVARMGTMAVLGFALAFGGSALLARALPSAGAPSQGMTESATSPPPRTPHPAPADRTADDRREEPPPSPPPAEPTVLAEPPLDPAPAGSDPEAGLGDEPVVAAGTGRRAPAEQRGGGRRGERAAGSGTRPAEMPMTDTVMEATSMAGIQPYDDIGF